MLYLVVGGPLDGEQLWAVQLGEGDIAILGMTLDHGEMGHACWVYSRDSTAKEAEYLHIAGTFYFGRVVKR